MLDVGVPVVWNSNFFMSDEAMRLLDGVVDLYVGDFRFGCDAACAESLGGGQRICVYSQAELRIGLWLWRPDSPSSAAARAYRLLHWYR